MTLQHSKIRFKVKGIGYTFNVVHNLEDFGIGIMAAFDNWIARTDSLSLQAFCDYVKEKDPENIICIPKVEYDKKK